MKKINIIKNLISAPKRKKKINFKNDLKSLGSFQVQIYEINWKSKNDLKSPLGALNKDLYEEFSDFEFWSKFTARYFSRKNEKSVKIKFQPCKEQ